MADRLTAAEFAAFARLNPRYVGTWYAQIINDAITLKVISDRIKGWGTLKTSLYNKHPKERGSLDFPLISVVCDNRDGYFDYGGTIFPNGIGDIETTLAQVRIDLQVEGEATAKTFYEITGQVREPEFDDSGAVELVIEHVLTRATGREWRREDRIGGSTGTNIGFA